MPRVLVSACPENRYAALAMHATGTSKKFCMRRIGRWFHPMRSANQRNGMHASTALAAAKRDERLTETMRGDMKRS
jgi:hypothetical protein